MKISVHFGTYCILCSMELQAWCLTSLNRIYRNEELTTKLLTPALQQSLVERIRDLWAPLDLTESGPMLDTFLAELLELSAFVITELQTTDLLKVCVFISFTESGISGPYWTLLSLGPCWIPSWLNCWSCLPL